MSPGATGGTLLFPEGEGTLRPGAFASVGLGVDMRADSPRARSAGLLLALALLCTGCVALTPAGQGTGLRYTPPEAAPPLPPDRPHLEPPAALTTPPPSPPGPEAPQRLHRRRSARETVTGAEPGPPGASEPSPQSATQTHQALLAALLDVSGSTRRLAAELSTLRASESGIAKAGVFLPYVAYAEAQRRWMEDELTAASTLAHTAREVEDPDMQLAAWVDFLHLTDFMLRHCPSCGVETLLRQMDGSRKLLEPAMTALSSLEPGQVEAAAADLPLLMGHLTEAYAARREALRVARENLEKFLVLKESLEALPLMSAMRLALPRLLVPAAPTSLGVGLVAGSGGVMMGTQVVVSAEWVEMMRRLVQAGVLSLPAVSAMVRIQAGQVLMAQAHDELPRGVREALGDSPEVRGMRVTGRAGAGMAEPPRHHVLPREHREWFEQRGFTGEMDIDQFCVRMERAGHEAIHGGGNWKLGRTWPGEWNRLIMDALRDAETKAGKTLTRSEILKVVVGYMKEYKMPMNFTR